MPAARAVGGVAAAAGELLCHRESPRACCPWAAQEGSLFLRLLVAWTWKAVPSLDPAALLQLPPLPEPLCVC